jgi:hypothetical protein
MGTFEVQLTYLFEQYMIKSWGKTLYNDWMSILIIWQMIL